MTVSTNDTTAPHNNKNDVEAGAAGVGGAPGPSLSTTKPNSNSNNSSRDTATTMNRRYLCCRQWPTAPRRKTIGLALLYAVLLASIWMASSSLLPKRQRTRVYQAEQMNKGYGYGSTPAYEVAIIKHMDELLAEYERGMTAILQFDCVNTQLFRDLYHSEGNMPRTLFVKTIQLSINPSTYYWVKGFQQDKIGSLQNVLNNRPSKMDELVTYDLRDALTHQAVLKLRSDSGMINGKRYFSGIEDSFCTPMYNQI